MVLSLVSPKGWGKIEEEKIKNRKIKALLVEG